MTEQEVYSNAGKIYRILRNEVGKVIVGQDEVMEQLMISILTGSHALVEGFPGLGKTKIISTLSKIMDLKFKRIQCTPDIMPSDITGTYIVEEHADGKKEFRFEKGPIFANIILADEINRATPKAQSALLEAMQEKQVTVGNTTYKLDEPFFVLATQNPIEMEGTYPLPEAQVDRFLLKVLINYPSASEEEKIVDINTGEEREQLKKILDKERLLILQSLTRKVPIANDIKKYALKIVIATRPMNNGIAKQYLEYGASPRASIGIILAAKARALINGRNYVAREDIDKMAYPVLRHRIILNFESERKGISADRIIREIIAGVR
ncbi:MAG: AAA family ATPase [Candidatus Altiarchaeales archaeon HGW-Altiarchaeales-3]|nr:MAG: AAA family ATPase [Candidatus Altiarchaeales archaeon HGW-Altiarchaeales-3]